MMVLISYDVSTVSASGRTLSGAKWRKNVTRIMLSVYRTLVFEADLDYSSFLKLEDCLIKLINQEEDSLRFYYLGNNWEKRIEHIGAKKTYNPETGVIII